MSEIALPKLTKADFVPNVEVRWCPGCGDYVILNAVQKVLPELGIRRENFVFVSGIGCSSRFPYYMNTYGFHTIHGRAPAFATGIKATNPELSVWVITGDGDGFSIGGNHLLHAMRRNVDIKILFINNRIYGLTKGQYSPTSEKGKVTKSTPFGSVDYPVNPLSVALSAGATFVARTADADIKHMGEVLTEAASHKGTAFIEIYQNCNIFNNHAFNSFTARENRLANCLYLKDGEMLLFGEQNEQRIERGDFEFKIVKEGGAGEDALKHHVHSSSNTYAHMLAEMTYPDFPVPLGVFRKVLKPTFSELMTEQENQAIAKKGEGSIHELLHRGDVWEVS